MAVVRKLATVFAVCLVLALEFHGSDSKSVTLAIFRSPSCAHCKSVEPAAHGCKPRLPGRL